MKASLLPPRVDGQCDETFAHRCMRSLHPQADDLIRNSFCCKCLSMLIKSIILYLILFLSIVSHILWSGGPDVY